MAKEYSRSQRVAEQIMRELAELIRLEVKDPRVGFITLTGVDITPDYAHAKVYFTSMQGAEGLSEILAGLRRASGFLRRELGNRTKLRYVPELAFHFDDGLIQSQRMSDLLDEIVSQEAPADEAAPGE